MKKKLLVATLLVAGAWSALGTADVQVAGSTTTLGVSVTELTQVALGWSVKKSILDKAVYNDIGEKIGNVEDLIISPDKRVSYLIIGAGGFLGIGRHDVAIPATQIQDTGAKLVMPGATKAALKSMPQFDYADDTTIRRERRARHRGGQGEGWRARQERSSSYQRREGQTGSASRSAAQRPQGRG
jgi:sporulation protein YlmC with PRC-barrel domain